MLQDVNVFPSHDLNTDESVPLWHSAELSLKTGMPLYVFEGSKHVNILKHKNNPQSGVELSEEEKKKLVNEADVK